ncbi:MAG: leucyl aminopeptidase family protein [Phycisphaeraceae bacterium]
MYRKMTLVRSTARPDAVAVFLPDPTTDLPAGYRELDAATGSALTAALARQELSLDRGAITTLYPTTGPGRVMICGLGKPERFEPNAVRAAGSRLARAAHAAGVKRLRVDPAPGVGEQAKQLATDGLGQALAEGLMAGAFNFDRFKGAAVGSKKDDAGDALALQAPAELTDGLERGLAVGHGQRTARELAATPPNVANPRYLVQQCRRLAREHAGLTCTIIDAAKAKELGMGGLLAVGRAGSTPPAVIVLTWKGGQRAGGGGGGGGGGPVMLVGKAVTFDTGGYSIKPGASMAGMKYDKCGGAAVIGAMEAIARTKLATHVVGVVPTAENLIDHTAFRPDDILTLANGVTVEVGNTDAEGRLILADALAWGTKRYKPRAVIDLATLTGGVVVALGRFCAGYMATDDALAAALEQAATSSGEKLWRLPLWDEHREQVRGSHADILNAAGRDGHPLQGGAFLSYFVGEDAPQRMPTLPWAHIDIAGMAKAESDGDGGGVYGKGPTGYGVRLLVEAVGRV